MKKIEKRTPHCQGAIVPPPCTYKCNCPPIKNVLQRILASLLLAALVLGQVCLPAFAADGEAALSSDLAPEGTTVQAAASLQGEENAAAQGGKEMTSEEIMAAPIPDDPAYHNSEGYTILSEESLAMLELSASLFSVEGDPLPHTLHDLPSPGCESEEHVHTIDCYTVTCAKEAHTHGVQEDGTICEWTVDSTLCSLPEHSHQKSGCSHDTTKPPTCGLEEHSHASSGCTHDKLICGKTEHTHGDGSACTLDLTCGFHEHTISCFYKWVGPDDIPHDGSAKLTSSSMCDSWYGDRLPDGNYSAKYWDSTTNRYWEYMATVPACGKQAGFHTHADTCYECTLTEHTHTDECLGWSCGKEEHIHTDTCYPWDCGMEEHTHTDDCKSWSCHKEEHAHAFPACYGADPICNQNEHLHSADCYEDGLTPADYAWANKTISAINDLNNWTLEEANHLAEAYKENTLTAEEEVRLNALKKTLSNANALYNALSPEQKVLVTNASYLHPETGYGFLLDPTYGTINFTVQYYCNQFQYNWGQGNDLTFIVPEGPGTPNNGDALHTQTLGLVDGRLDKTWKELPFYADREFLYDNDLEESISRIDRLSTENSAGGTDSEDYVITKLQVIDATGAEETVIAEYTGTADTLRLTDGDTRTEGDIQYIHVDDGMTLRICYDNAESKTATNPAHFFDYDVTDGNFVQQKYVGEWNNWPALSNQDKGINADANYDSDGVRLTFGGETRGVTHAMDVYDGTYLNSTRTGPTTTNDFSCTYHLVGDTLDPNGNLRYSVDSPYLFCNEDPGTVTQGKTQFSGSLIFEQEGNTYTLSSASVYNGSITSSIGGLRDFSKTSAGPLSNGFWPMDNIYDYQKVWFSTTQFDENGCALRYYSEEEAAAAGIPADQYMLWAPGHDPLDRPENGYEGGVSNWLSQSTKSPNDDADKYRNPFFGMEFEVDFAVPRDYLGEMKYIFYGDDDMFVYLTNTKTHESRLIADLGGVHSSVGYVVDLWDYIDPTSWGPEEDLRDYRLSVFYTERGAYGSSCYIQYRLPNATPVPVEVPSYYDLEVDKTVTGQPAEEDQNARFQFKVTFAPKCSPTCTNQNGETVSIVYDENGVGVFTLADGEKIKFSNIPIGVTYTIEEEGKLIDNKLISSDSADYHFNVSYTKGDETTGQTGNTVTGTPTANESVHFRNTASSGVELPLTGGPGTSVYTIIGMTLVIGALLPLLSIRKRKKL